MANRSRKNKNETCVLCCKPIIEGKDEALMCEGETCGNKWMHRYCAGVSTAHYKLLETSPSPYYCCLCTQLKQAAIIEEMRGTIASLTAEVIELRATIESRKATRESMQTTNSNVEDSSRTNGRSWSEVVRRGNRSKARNSKRSPRAMANGNHQASSSSSSAKIKIEGKRKIWGTWPTTSVSAVKNAIKGITKLDEVSVKRKYKTARSGRGNSARVSKWWFILNGREELLKKLDEKWSTVKLQTNWTLEPVFCFDEGSTQEDQPDVPSNTIADLSQSHGQEQVDSDSISNATGSRDDISPPNDNNVSNSVSSQD